MSRVICFVCILQKREMIELSEAPRITHKLRRRFICVPEEIKQASGIVVFERNIRSLVFTTDVAVIMNNNADAVIAVYPFTAQTVITHAIMSVASAPVFYGVGGGVTNGSRVVELARDAEFSGAAGVVVNAPTQPETISYLKEILDIPVVYTVVSENSDYRSRVEAGASILNISGAGKTIDIIKKVRKEFPKIPIIATGGGKGDVILQTIEAGANAISYTPPTSAALLRQIMDEYRETH